MDGKSILLIAFAAIFTIVGIWIIVGSSARYEQQSIIIEGRASVQGYTHVFDNGVEKFYKVFRVELMSKVLWVLASPNEQILILKKEPQLLSTTTTNHSLSNIRWSDVRNSLFAQYLYH